jgi:tRNA A37 N6-isopentenylltransferase MiaA
VGRGLCDLSFVVNLEAADSIVRRALRGSIEERFLSARADAFTRSEREEKASARSARNDRIVRALELRARAGAKAFELASNWKNASMWGSK